MRLRGKVGNTTYYTQGGRQIARVSENSSNYGEDARRSPKQQRRRVMWANLVNFYKVSANWMHGAFETKKANETDYNKFMSVNLPSARVALTKEQAVQGCCVYDSFIVSQGTMYNIAITRSGNTATTNIRNGLTAQYLKQSTIGAVSAHLIDKNPWLYNGCQLSFINYSLDFDGPGLPKLRMGRAEFTLDTTSEEQFDTLDIADYLDANGGFLTWNELDEDGYVTIILSDSTNGSLKVSTQSLVPGDADMPASYATEEKVQAAMESYGVDQAYFLESGYE